MLLSEALGLAGGEQQTTSVDLCLISNVRSVNVYPLCVILFYSPAKVLQALFARKFILSKSGVEGSGTANMGDLPTDLPKEVAAPQGATVVSFSMVQHA